MYIVVVNPEAGFGKSEKLFRLIQQDDHYKKSNCRAFFTQYEGHGAKIAEQVAEMHKEQLECLIVVGGDGTLHEVVNGLKNHSDVPIAFIPAGSGNDFARGLSLRHKGVELFRRIVTNPRKFAFYPGVFVMNKRHKHGQQYFVNSIGFGLDGAVVAEANRSLYRGWIRRLRLSPLTYPLALIKAIRNYEPIDLDMRLDGVSHQLKQATMVTVTNHPYYGGGMKITPRAKLHQSKFHILIIEHIPKWKILALFMLVFFGAHTRIKGVTEQEVSSVEIHANQPIPVQVDGQSATCHTCEVKKSVNKRWVYRSS
ncbi:diacylglycerol kinase family lipid kinase [Halobacillus fulvus]|nr:diacylglycerol kinase family lipid kinase [Halobacillus fulvus]